MKIEMTGAEDREGPWKVSIAGAPGAGKTMMASTAPEPLFVFFQQEPRIKSIADRSVPHVKIVNDFTSGSYAAEQMQALIMHLSMGDHHFKTLVIDTGDEFFQQMKAGRTHMNGGEFNIGDWGWIADTYREIMLAIIDLPMHVIVNFHTKLTTDEDHSFREIMLQGQVKDEAAGWFDIVGALDTYEVLDESGAAETRRVFLTEQSRMYPWVKDHSGAMPRRFDLSPHITNDFLRLLELVSTSGSDVPEKQVLQELEPVPPPTPPVNQEIPSPEELDEKKAESHQVPEEPSQVEASAPIDTQDTQPPSDTSENDEGKDKPSDPIRDRKTGSASADAPPGTVDSQANVEPVEPTSSDESSEDNNTIQPSGPVSEAVAVAELQDQLGAEEQEHVTPRCKVCDVEVTDTDLHELTTIRFQQYLCLPHFKEKLQK